MGIRVWGEPLKAVQMPDPDSPSFGYGETGSRNRSSNFDRIVSPQGTTVMYVPPTETDSYYGDSDLYPFRALKARIQVRDSIHECRALKLQSKTTWRRNATQQRASALGYHLSS